MSYDCKTKGLIAASGLKDDSSVSNLRPTLGSATSTPMPLDHKLKSQTYELGTSQEVHHDKFSGESS